MDCCTRCFYKIFGQKQLPREYNQNLINKSNNIAEINTKHRQNTEIFRTLNQNKKITQEDFEIIQKIGVGSNSEVFLARFKKAKGKNNIFAVKIVQKSKNNEFSYDNIITERAVMSTILSPLLMPIYFSFQSDQCFYLVMEYMIGGDLMGFLQKNVFLQENKALFYISEIVVAIEALHNNNIIHRDIKLENIFIAHNGHIKLADYGQAKNQFKSSQVTNTICGSPNYLAPEVIFKQKYNFSVDWWQLGILVYELLAGQPPFHDENPYQLLKNITNVFFLTQLNFKMRDHFSDGAKSLINRFLVLDPNKRLGSMEGSQEIKSHQFFQKVQWEDVEKLEYQPFYVPKYSSQSDVTNLNLVKINNQSYINFLEKNQKKIYQKQLSNDQINNYVEGFSYQNNKIINQ